MEQPSPQLSLELSSVLLSVTRLRRELERGEYGRYFVAYTDGSCVPASSDTPYGEGGWSLILVAPRGERWESSDSILLTTSNRAEVCGLLAAVSAVPDGSSLGVQSDSRYVVDHVRRGCQAADNDDLWREVRELLVGKGLTLTSSWVPGHSGHSHNERADQLASLRGGRKLFQRSQRPR